MDGMQREVTLNVIGINSNITREKHLAVDMIVGICIFLLPALGFLWGAGTAHIGSEAFYWFSGGFLVFLLPVGLCWREYVRKSYDLLVFSEPRTGNQLVLYRNIPDAATVDAFVGALQTAIARAGNQVVAEGAQIPGMISYELERLASLRDRGVLSEPEFQKAKAALLERLTEKPKIGFQP